MGFVNSRGEEQEEAPGPRGDRMAQLGILTRAQKKKPTMSPMDQAGASKLQQTLAEKAQERKMQLRTQGPANTIPEADPMKKSMTKTAVPQRPR